jgi:hypothetical protein
MQCLNKNGPTIQSVQEEEVRPQDQIHISSQSSSTHE